MRFQSIYPSILLGASSIVATGSFPPQSAPDAFSTSPLLSPAEEHNPHISIQLFSELEELSRIVDISYCVGTTGISKPFQCASRCLDFPDFELVTTFNTGPLMSDSCGYVVLDHGKAPVGHIGEKRGRIIVAFRGTYSIANTIVDLSTVPQEYAPYPEKPGNSTSHEPDKEKSRHRFWDWIPRPGFLTKARRAAYQESKAKARAIEQRTMAQEVAERKCENCTVHTGFWTSWQNTRSVILPHIVLLKNTYPDYDLHLVGHSLGGAVAALAGLEFEGPGWKPIITSFGEPRVGNAQLRDYIDDVFALRRTDSDGRGNRYRRVTHIDDPVPLLPLQEWGYRAHAGEVYIAKAALSPAPSDLRICLGDEDTNCIAGAEVDESWFDATSLDLQDTDVTIDKNDAAVTEITREKVLATRWGVPIPARYKFWQLFFAHRDYFWRLGLCVPGGDPLDWRRPHYNFTNVNVDPKPEL